MKFILRRLAFYMATAWVAITINFILPRLMPGNPVLELFNRLRITATPGAIRAFDIAFGVSTREGLTGQYWSYLGQLAHGNLGISITYNPTTVASVIGQALPWTVALLGVATVLSFLIGTLLGMFSATRRDAYPASGRSTGRGSSLPGTRSVTRAPCPSSLRTTTSRGALTS